MGRTGTLTIGNEEYVVIPRAEYLRMQGLPEDTVEAVEFATASIARGLREARDEAQLSQDELAKKLKVSRSMVANTEAGRINVSERYIRRVLKACGLPADWKSPKD